MRTGSPGFRSLAGFIASLCIVFNAYGLSQESAKSLSIGDTDDRVAAIGRVLVAEPDDGTAAFIRALVDDAVKVSGGRVFIVRDGVGTDPVTGQPVTVPDDAEDVMNNNRLRGELTRHWRPSACCRPTWPSASRP